MSPKQKGVHRELVLRVLDLYENKDQLAPISFSAKRDGQTMTPSDRIQRSADFQTVRKSGWMKPSFQVGALLLLREKGTLNLYGERRLHKLLNNIRYEEVYASISNKEKISNDPQAHGALLRWVCRPLYLASYNRKEKRRIGVGYRDKGSLPPSHLQGRNGVQEVFFLGEKKEYLSDYHLKYFQLLGFNGYPPFHHLGGGWWRPLSFSERINFLRKWTDELINQV